MSTFWINPIIFQIGPIALHWYGLMYALTFILAYLILQYSSLGKKLPLSAVQKDNLLIIIILGIVLGGRLGYILFYNLEFYLKNPLKIAAIWEGGLSFHGGLLGTLIAIGIVARRYKIPFLQIADIAAFITPIGIFLGRIGNFINGELYGRITNKFCLYFPTDPINCRYPSQLFEAASEGVLLFCLMYLLSKHYQKTKVPYGKLSAAFLVLYGLARTAMEFFREPDAQIGFLWGGTTLGQILSSLMIIAGLILLIYFHKKPAALHNTNQ